MKRSRTPSKLDDERVAKKNNRRASNVVTPTKSSGGVKIGESKVKTPEKKQDLGAEKGKLISKRRALEGQPALETPFERKLPAKPLVTPFNRKKQDRTETTYYSPFTKRQENIEQNLIQQYEKRKHIRCFPRVMCIEGNIGSGKSTLLRELEKKGFCVLQEPVNKTWCKFLPLMYSDPKRWGMTFQLEVLNWFHTLGEKILPELSKSHPRIIVERSPMSSFFIFCSNLYSEANMTDWEYDKIKWVFELCRWKPRKTLYLQVSPEVCCERIRQRNRSGEEDIDSKLMENLHKRHERCFSQNEDEDVEVFVLDAEQNIEKVTEEALRALASPTTKYLSTRNSLRQKHSRLDKPTLKRVRTPTVTNRVVNPMITNQKEDDNTISL